MTAITGMLGACQKPDLVTRGAQNTLSDIFATIEGKGSARLFEPAYSANKDTIYFNIPYFYPVDSDNQLDLTRIILRSTIPTDAAVAPALGQPMDLSKPVSLVVTAGTGLKTFYTIVAKRVADLAVRKATIAYQDNGSPQDLDAIINNNGDATFYVIPGTDVSQVKLSYSLNPHSTGSIAQDATIDLTQPVPFTVTGVDGSKQTYTLKAQEPRKLSYGVGISRLFWKKNASELSGFATNDVNRAMAVSGDYLVVVVSNSPSTYKIYDRKTGAYVQDMAVPPGNLRSFAILNDTAGHLLVTSYAAKNGVFYIYRYNDAFDTNPVKLVQWTNNNPAAIAGDGGVGRRVNLYGDASQNAIITAPAGVSTVIYRWTIQNGAAVSSTPDPVTYQSITGGTTWSFYAEAQPVSAVAGGDYFVNYPGEIALVSGAGNSRSTAFTTETSVVGEGHLAMDYFTFNHANYLALATFKSNATRAGLSLFDVTNPSKIGLKSTDAGFSDFRVFASTEELSATSNGNAVADVCTCYSGDGQRVYVYTLLTNGGIMAYEFTMYAP